MWFLKAHLPPWQFGAAVRVVCTHGAGPGTSLVLPVNTVTTILLLLKHSVLIKSIHFPYLDPQIARVYMQCVVLTNRKYRSVTKLCWDINGAPNTGKRYKQEV